MYSVNSPQTFPSFSEWADMDFEVFLESRWKVIFFPFSPNAIRTVSGWINDNPWLSKSSCFVIRGSIHFTISLIALHLKPGANSVVEANPPT